MDIIFSFINYKITNQNITPNNYETSTQNPQPKSPGTRLSGVTIMAKTMLLLDGKGTSNTPISYFTDTAQYRVLCWRNSIYNIKLHRVDINQRVHGAYPVGKVVVSFWVSFDLDALKICKNIQGRLHCAASTVRYARVTKSCSKSQ